MEDTEICGPWPRNGVIPPNADISGIGVGDPEKSLVRNPKVDFFLLGTHQLHCSCLLYFLRFTCQLCPRL